MILSLFICTKFSKLILRKIIKIDAKRRQILSTKCTKFDVGWSSAPDPAGELTVLPRPPSWLEGALLLRGGDGKEGQHPPKKKPGFGPACSHSRLSAKSKSKHCG